jgi:hypothetical protein
VIKVLCDRHGLTRDILIAMVLGALLFIVPPARADGPSCENNFAHSGIAWTGNSVGVVASDNNDFSGGNLYYFWQQTGTGTWHRELVAAANGGTCPGNCTGWCTSVPWGYSSDAIAWTDESMVIAAVDQRDGGIYYWWQAKDTGSWHQQKVAAGPPGCCSFGSVVNGVVTPSVWGYSMPSIAWTGKSVVLTACDHQGGLHYWFEEKGRTTWYHELVAKQGCSWWQPSIAWTGSSVVIAATCNANGGICYYWQAAGSGVWNRQVVDSAANDGPPSIAWTGNAVIITAQGGGLIGVIYWWQAAGTQTWHKQQVVGMSESAFGLPAIAAADDSVVIASGEEAPQQNHLDYWWEPFTSTGNWTLQYPSGNGDFSAWTDPGAIAWTGVSVVIVSTTACGDLDYWWQQKDTTTWHKQRIVANTDWPPGTC